MLELSIKILGLEHFFNNRNVWEQCFVCSVFNQDIRFGMFLQLATMFAMFMISRMILIKIFRNWDVSSVKHGHYEFFTSFNQNIQLR